MDQNKYLALFIDTSLTLSNHQVGSSYGTELFVECVALLQDTGVGAVEAGGRGDEGTHPGHHDGIVLATDSSDGRVHYIFVL